MAASINDGATSVKSDSTKELLNTQPDRVQARPGYLIESWSWERTSSEVHMLAHYLGNRERFREYTKRLPEQHPPRTELEKLFSGRGWVRVSERAVTVSWPLFTSEFSFDVMLNSVTKRPDNCLRELGELLDSVLDTAVAIVSDGEQRYPNSRVVVKNVQELTSGGIYIHN